MNDFGGCTCGPYMSVIPPEPCPIHDPERAYWRMKLLKEFGGYTTTTTTASTIPKYEPYVPPEPIVHFNQGYYPSNKLACGADPSDDNATWARITDWITCEDCKEQLNGSLPE